MVAASSAGHSGAASATWEHVHRHFAVAALLSPETPLRTIEMHVDFDLTAAWRHHVSMPPSSLSQSAATTALRKVHSELFRLKLLCEIPHWLIFLLKHLLSAGRAAHSKTRTRGSAAAPLSSVPESRSALSLGTLACFFFAPDLRIFIAD